ncbi:MAG: N-acetylmuramoyl-L-alanine amidase [Bacteroidetes bacterium]|nr:N-acetylmuramoyl-L-alanine amidase [Bacteroidota bacterium]MBS1930121.1 N-acetylmuramoyl-L-alanine amidase [Bacteroidota bacterium]
MKSLFYYLLQVIIVSGILYAYFHLFLRNKKFHHYNRFYILAAAMLSIFIPFLNIPVYFTHTQAHSSFVLYTLSNISAPSYEINPLLITTPAQNWFTWQNVLFFAYILIASIVFLKVVLSLINIRRIIKQNTVEKIKKIRFVNTEEPGTPFSFFRWLFWNRKIELQSSKGEQIFRHELFHIEQKHSWDIIFMEILTVLFWINPFFYLVKKEIKAIHEFLADRFAVTENRKWEYAELLLMQALNTQNHLINPFFHNQIKRRIAMLTTSTKTGHQYLRKVLVLPLAAIVLALFAFKYKEKESLQSQLPPGQTYTVVIDAGHGGTEPGTEGSYGVFEKDIVLSIAHKVKSLNNDDNLKIFLTRDDDVTVPLQDRTGLSNNKAADLFISLHVNAQAITNEPATKKSGIEVYIPSSNKTFYSENRILASILLNYFSQLHPVNNSIQHRNKKIWVLENTQCPSAMIELGYMNNNDDLQFIKQPANQAEIAKTILQSIDQYFLQKESNDWEERKKDVLDTIPIFSQVARKQGLRTQDAVIFGGKNENRYSIYSDSLIFKSDINNPDLKDALIILNGKKIDPETIFNKTVIAKMLTVYPENDPQAISKFGPAAKNGVLIFEDAKFKNFYNPDKAIPDTLKPDNKVVEKVEIEASFPGGEQAWRKYLERNISNFNPADKGAPNGTYTVYIQFVVDKEGYISDVKPLTRYGYGMEDVAVNLIKKCPRWIPAMQNGHEVKAYRKQPITFVVSEEKKSTGVNEKNAVTSKKIPGNTKIFEKTEVSPSFPGGDLAWRKYLIRTLSGYNPADSGAAEGTYKVIAQFIVDKKGNLNEIKTLTHFGHGMENKVIAMLKSGPKWLPAMQNGHKVAAYIEQPVTFVIQKE